VTAIVWDKVGRRFYQTGVDRGVLYLKDNTSAAWNGLTSVEETSSTELKSFWLDGVKYLDNLLPGDFSGKLSAFTYPDEFDSVNGIVDVAPGLTYYDQPSKSFNLTYRTQIGNDVDGTDYGYKIHLLYNIIANPDSYKFESLKDQASAIEFSWTLVGTPPMIHGYRPTVHVSIDSNETDPDTLKYIEDILYGTATTDPYFPTINEILDLFKNLGALIIVDNGDGTWQAIDQANTYITMISSTEFQIDGADATYLDATTYEISTTNPD
jgi:hypothetical protein